MSLLTFCPLKSLIFSPPMILSSMLPWLLTPEPHCHYSPHPQENHFQASPSGRHLLTLQLTCLRTLPLTLPQPHSALKSTDLTIFSLILSFSNLYFLPGIKFCGPSLRSFSCIHPQFLCFHLPLLFSCSNTPT